MLQKGDRLIVVGFGNMGKAIVRSLIEPGARIDREPLWQNSDVVLADPKEPLAKYARLWRIKGVSSAQSLPPLHPGDTVLIAVKPQVFPEVALPLRRQITDVGGNGVLVLSVMAGVTCDRLAEALGPRARVVRAMPNVCAQIKQSASAFCLGAGAKRGDATIVREVLGSIGPTVVEIDESLMNAFTAVAGSGPAYLFFLAEAMAEGARAAGFDSKTADAIVRQTIFGASSLLESESKTSPSTLRASVTSKGGTTEAALEVLAQTGVSEALVAAILAARSRARELGRRV